MSVGGFGDDELSGAPVNGVPGMVARARERIGGYFGKVMDETVSGTRYRVGDTSTTPERNDQLSPREQYEMLRALAGNFNAYGELSTLMAGYNVGDVAIQGLGNPSNAVAAFYESVLWDGTIREDDAASALPLEIPLIDSDDPDAARRQLQ